jgi:hypothetical protein
MFSVSEQNRSLVHSLGPLEADTNGISWRIGALGYICELKMRVYFLLQRTWEKYIHKS